VGANPIPFDRFLEEQRLRVLRYLGAAVGPADADDVFQETFLAALRAWPDVVDDGRLDRWILKIASRKAIDHHRRRLRRPVPVAETPDRPVTPEDPMGDPIWASVALLPVAQREAVLCRFALDLPYREIGDLLGITPEAARANVYQGMKKLRERI
jgi:RNA polymerase sigma factor (sigma-70 family)